MTKAKINAGICGFDTTVEASMNGSGCMVRVKSQCRAIQKLAEKLDYVDPFQEITFRHDGPLTLSMAKQYCSHTACPVPVGIIKAVEVEAGLALPAEASIKLFKS